MARGPGIDMNNFRTDLPMNEGIRIITNYWIAFDLMQYRIDVKIGDKQYAAGFNCSVPIKSISGSKFKPTDDLITPIGVENCINVKANKNEILRALKELINDIENDGVKNVER